MRAAASAACCSPTRHGAAHAAEAMLRGRWASARPSIPAIMTSGEAVHLALLRPGPTRGSRRSARRVFHLGPERDRNVMDGLGPHAGRATPAEAELRAEHGARRPCGRRRSRRDVRSRCWQECRAAWSLPMICANPDLEVIRGGVRVICAGALAARYQEMGGDVSGRLGKPDPAIYTPGACDLLQTPQATTLAVGDSRCAPTSPERRAAGIDACWVLGGIHGAKLGGAALDGDAARRQAALAGLEAGVDHREVRLVGCAAGSGCWHASLRMVGVRRVRRRLTAMSGIDPCNEREGAAPLGGVVVIKHQVQRSRVRSARRSACISSSSWPAPQLA